MRNGQQHRAGPVPKVAAAEPEQPLALRVTSVRKDSRLEDDDTPADCTGLLNFGLGWEYAEGPLFHGLKRMHNHIPNWGMAHR